jgi:hypothetical protein
MYAVRDPATRAWSRSLVDDQNGLGGGQSCQLALDAADRPHVIYAGNVNGILRYSVRNGTAWSRETVGAGQQAGYYDALALTAQASPQVLYHKRDGGLIYARRLQGDFGTYWSGSFVQPGLAGLFNDLAVGARGTLHAAYHDYAPATLAYARSVELEDPPRRPPAIWVLEPRSGARVSGPIKLHATASSSVGISHVEFLVDGTAVGVVSAAPYAVEWNPRPAGEGVHTITARATAPDGQTVEQTVKVLVVRPLR